MAEFNADLLEVSNQVCVHQVVLLGSNYFDVDDVCNLLNHFALGQSYFDCSLAELQICQFLVSVGLLNCSQTIRKGKIFEPVSEEAEQQFQVMLETLRAKQEEVRKTTE